MSKSRELLERGDPSSSSSSWVREMERRVQVGQAMVDEAIVRCFGEVEMRGQGHWSG